MYLVLSPSKTQNFENGWALDQYSQPALLEEAETLAHELQQYTREGLANLLDVSEKLANLNYKRYQQFSLPFTKHNAKPALLAYQGDVFNPMGKDHYSDSEWKFAHQHVGIFSGLYGILSPLDLIQPYRLEMNTKLKNPAGDNLYNFWREKVTDFVNQRLQEVEPSVLINLASNQYFKVLQKADLKGDVVTPKFQELKNGQYKTIAIYAKKARGKMTDYIIRNQITDPEALKAFTEWDYQFDEERSSEKEWVFTRHSSS